MTAGTDDGALPIKIDPTSQRRVPAGAADRDRRARERARARAHRRACKRVGVARRTFLPVALRRRDDAA